MLEEFKDSMKIDFDMNDLGLIKYFLGIEIEKSSQCIFVCQQKYAIEIMRRFRMDKCKPAETPIALGMKLSTRDQGSTFDSILYNRLVGCLVYLTTTRPHIMFAARFVSRFMESPKDSHWKFGKRILRYVAGTINYGLWYTTSKYYSLAGYTDGDFAGSIDDRKNTSSYVFHLGSNLISWESKK
jgi:hypothetical protein